jgi:hypothetical protein
MVIGKCLFSLEAIRNQQFSDLEGRGLEFLAWTEKILLSTSTVDVYIFFFTCIYLLYTNNAITRITLPHLVSIN